jgi:hypothetical protein
VPSLAIFSDLGFNTLSNRPLGPVLGDARRKREE